MDLINAFQLDCIKNDGKPVWISPEFYYDLQEIGWITFDANSEPQTMGHQVRVITELPVEYKFADN